MESQRELKQQVFEANLELVRQGLVIYTWGNVSGVCRERNLMAIKPSGVAYADLTVDHISLVRLDDGELVEGLKPSSDTPTHLELYRAFPSLGGVTHTHSAAATAFAQARREIVCLGTTHADYFYGDVPVTDELSADDIRQNYEANTGKRVVERLRRGGFDPLAMPAALVAGHGPFTWGKTPGKSVENAVVLEAVAAMNLRTASLCGSNPTPLSKDLLDKHFLRKHGSGAYYGQG